MSDPNPTPPLTDAERLLTIARRDASTATRCRDITDLLARLEADPKALSLKIESGHLKIDDILFERLDDDRPSPLLDEIRRAVLLYLNSVADQATRRMRARLAELTGEPPT